VITLAFLALAVSAPQPNAVTALAKWLECIDDNTAKLTEEIGQTPYTPARKQLADAIGRVALARCERLWGGELQGVNKNRERQSALKRARATAEGLFQNYDLEGL
jgi:hypothetical protein